MGTVRPVPFHPVVLVGMPPTFRIHALQHSAWKGSGKGGFVFLWLVALFLAPAGGSVAPCNSSALFSPALRA